MTLMMISDNADAITCLANGTIDAGAFVKSVSSDDVVTSAGLSSFIPDDIKVEEADDGSTDYTMVIGIASEDASSGDYLTVYTQGLFIVRAGEAITTGVAIQMAEDTDEYEVDALDAGAGEHRIGVALTGSSAADTYIVIKLNI